MEKVFPLSVTFHSLWFEMYQILALAKIAKIAMPESKGASPLQLLFPVLPLLPFFNKQKNH